MADGDFYFQLQLNGNLLDNDAQMAREMLEAQFDEGRRLLERDLKRRKEGVDVPFTIHDARRLALEIESRANPDTPLGVRVAALSDGLGYLSTETYADEQQRESND